MSLLREKLKEVGMSMFPIILIVLIVHLTIVPLESHVFSAFLLGAVLVYLGLSIFLFGADLGIGEMGNHMGSSLVATNKLHLAVITGVILGFLITVAEPDLHILATQIQTATDGAVSSISILVVVSAGVAMMIGIAILGLIRRWRLSVLFAISYGSILILSFFVPPAFFAWSFDSSGATTGALTVPFILAFGFGLAQRLRSQGEGGVFGFVGLASVGPIIAVMLMSILSGQDSLTASEVAVQPATNLWMALGETIVRVSKEVLIAVVPLIVMYIAFQWVIKKAPRRTNRRIVVGFIYTFIGLVLFLTGVHVGFLNVGLLIGRGIASIGSLPLFVGISFILGLVVILAEPAVHVLADQVETVTSGAIRRSYILISLCLGVAAAVTLSALRIWLPWLSLWHILLPGFGTAVVLGFFSRPSFVGMAFDSGGVASGPMAATFILAYAQGAASVVPTADVLADGFGIIALIAMTPTVAIQILGLLYEKKSRKEGLNIVDRKEK